MTEIAVSAIGTAFLCGVGIILGKLCKLRHEVPSTEYIIIRKDHYDYLKNNGAKKDVIQEQPQISELQKELPPYSKHDETLMLPPTPPPLIAL